MKQAGNAYSEPEHDEAESEQPNPTVTTPAPTPTAPNNGNGASSDVMAGLASLMLPHLAGKVLDEDRVRALVDEGLANSAETIAAEVAQLVASARKTIEIKAYDRPSVTIDRAHASFERLLYYVSQRRSVYLHGPMGTGKSHAASQAAQALGLRFAYVSLNPQSPASLLTGFLDAHSHYCESTFYQLYRDGGVYCIDELDNASPALLTMLNSALANGQGSFPCGMVPRHPDFVLIATGNTSGRGGDWRYPERRKIDEATLDRLSFVEFGYDRNLELALCLDINAKAKPWCSWVWKVREYCEHKDNGIRGGVYATQRAILAGAHDLANGPADLTVSEIADTTVFKGLDADTRVKILTACPLPEVTRS